MKKKERKSAINESVQKAKARVAIGFLKTLIAILVPVLLTIAGWIDSLRERLEKHNKLACSSRYGARKDYTNSN